MERTTIQVGSYGVNCTILSCEGNAWVADPGGEADRIIEILVKGNLKLKAIILTHAHFDHVGGIAGLMREYPGIPIYLHDEDLEMFMHPANVLLPEYKSMAEFKNIIDATHLNIDGIEVIHTPGHSKGSVCYYLPNEQTVLTGDTLFCHSIGRTDFPGGSMSQMTESLRKISKLPKETLVIPGHGSFTTIAEELKENPYLV